MPIITVTPIQSPLNVANLKEHIDTSLKAFGTYNYYDKGADEVTDVTNAVYIARDMIDAGNVADLRTLLVTLASYGEDYAHFVAAVIYDLEAEPDEIWDFLMGDPVLEKLYL